MYLDFITLNKTHVSTAVLVQQRNLNLSETPELTATCCNGMKNTTLLEGDSKV